MTKKGTVSYTHLTLPTMKLLEEQKYSGMNMKRFCDERNISYDLFKYYKYSIRNKDQSTSLPAFIPVKQASDETLTFTLNGNTVSLVMVMKHIIN